MVGKISASIEDVCLGVLMNKQYSCSIIIRCYNEEQHIGRLLIGIMQQTAKDVEIILVDSGSTDATLSIASRYPTKVGYINLDEFTFGLALNVGCEAATDECIVNASAHVNPVYNDWLERLLAPFADSQIALVYGKQRGNEITKVSEHQILAKWFPEHFNLNKDHPFYNNANAASKGAIVALTHAMAIELAPDNIRVNVILPGAVDTPMLHAGLNRKHIQDYNTEVLMHELGEMYVIGRVGQPEEIGQTILFLAYCQSSFITGQSIIIDGKATVGLSAG